MWTISQKTSISRGPSVTGIQYSFYITSVPLLSTIFVQFNVTCRSRFWFPYWALEITSGSTSKSRGSVIVRPFSSTSALFSFLRFACSSLIWNGTYFEVCCSLLSMDRASFHSLYFQGSLAVLAASLKSMLFSWPMVIPAYVQAILLISSHFFTSAGSSRRCGIFRLIYFSATCQLFPDCFCETTMEGQIIKLH